MIALYESAWTDYELIDSGNFEKLERFGQYVLIRSEPQAIWPPRDTSAMWEKRAHARFRREQKDNYRFAEDGQGGWQKLKSMPDHWQMAYGHADFSLQLRLVLTSFGHVGVFPEQANNWQYIFRHTSAMKHPRVLNLFAYTGAASVVAALAGAEVTHVDSSKPSLNWANQNRQLNGIEQRIRWLHEDALKFVRREAKRGNTYQGIIMDPPPYGRGAAGEKWTLQEKLNELIAYSKELLAGDKTFFILSMYAVGLSAIVGSNVVRTHFPDAPIEMGELYLYNQRAYHLPMGTVVRFATNPAAS